MVFNFFHRTEEVKSSWIDFTTNDVPEIKVGYNILISFCKNVDITHNVSSNPPTLQKRNSCTHSMPMF